MIFNFTTVYSNVKRPLRFKSNYFPLPLLSPTYPILFSLSSSFLHNKLMSFHPPPQPAWTINSSCTQAIASLIHAFSFFSRFVCCVCVWFLLLYLLLSILSSFFFISFLSSLCCWCFFCYLSHSFSCLAIPSVNFIHAEIAKWNLQRGIIHWFNSSQLTCVVRLIGTGHGGLVLVVREHSNALATHCEMQCVAVDFSTVPLFSRLLAHDLLNHFLLPSLVVIPFPFMFLFLLCSFYFITLNILQHTGYT